MSSPSNLNNSMAFRSNYSSGRHHHRNSFLHIRYPSLLPSLLLALSLTIAFLTHFSTTFPQPTPSLRTLPEETPPHSCPRASHPPLYVFLHLHKTAGNHLKTALFSFAKKNDLNLHHTCHPTIGDSPFQSFWFNRQKPSNSVDCNLDALSSLPLHKRSQIDLVMGHQFVGAHSLFPGRDVRYFTFVRHPMMRKTSHFMHFEKGANLKRLAQYLVERNRNYMTKRLATDANPTEVGADLRGRFVDVDHFAARAALRAAKRNLEERFFFVGLVERYRESVCVLNRIFARACGKEEKLAHVGFKVDRLVQKRENYRGKTEKWVKRLSEDVRSAALRAEGADVQLYKFAQMLFERKLKLYPECGQL